MHTVKLSPQQTCLQSNFNNFSTYTGLIRDLKSHVPNCPFVPYPYVNNFAL
jgi:hypothetical protein